MKDKNSVFRSLVLVTQFGINMLVPILLCTLIGVYIGKRFSIPIIAVPLAFMGALAGFRNIYIIVKRMCKKEDESDAKKNQ